MARNRLPIKDVTDFSGGKVDIMSATKLRDSESPSLLNIQFKENGLASKRDGTALYLDEVDSRVCGLGRLYTATNKYHVRNSGTKLYVKSGSTWSALTGKTYTANKDTNYVQVRGCLYTHNKVDTMGKFDGTTLSTPAYGCTGSFGIMYSERQVVSGNPSAPSRLYFSSSKSADNFTGLSGTASAGGASTLTDASKAWVVNEYQSLIITITSGVGAGQVRTISSNTGTVITVNTAWTTNPDNTSNYDIEGGDTLDVSKDDGQAVTGLAKFEEKLIVFKEKSHYEITFDSTGNPIVQLINASYGCVSHRTIDGVENDIMFLSGDGVRTLGYVLNLPGTIRTNLVSTKIQGEIDNINATYYEKCAAIYFKKHYILTIPSGSSTTNNRVLAFNTLYGSWTVWDGMNINCFNEFISETDNKEHLYCGSDTSGQSIELFTTNLRDTNLPINSYFYTKQFDLGNPNVTKGIVFIDIQLRSLTGTLGIDVILDGQSTSVSTSLSSTFSNKDGLRVFKFREAMFREDIGSTADLVATDDIRRIYINKDARTIQLKVYNSNLNEGFTLMGLWIGYQPRSPFVFDSNKQIY